MKKVLTLAAVAVLCFVLGTAGIYFAMPSLSPDRVDSTRVRLDRLGLLPGMEPDPAALPDSLTPDSSDSTVVADLGPSPQEIIRSLTDSIDTYISIVQSLSSDTSALVARINGLEEQVDQLTRNHLDATDLSKSLAKLDAKQLGNILAGLHVETIELLYQKASARERTLLLESMSSEQAARFVRTLVKGPQPEAAAPAESAGIDPANAAQQDSSIQ